MKYTQSGGGYYFKVYKNGKKKRISEKEYKQKGGDPLNNDKLVNKAINDAIKLKIEEGEGLDRGITKKLRFVFNIGSTSVEVGYQKKKVTTTYLVAHKDGFSERMVYITKSIDTFEKSNEMSEGHKQRLQEQLKLYPI